MGKETREGGTRQAGCRGQALVHEPVRQREAEVRHQHGGHEREARAPQGDPVLQVAEITVVGGSRGAIQSPRIVREKCEDHGRDGEQERRPEEGALPAAKELE
ncbi:MAG: hypothetical protein ACK56I_13420, partial [bacterium]